MLNRTRHARLYATWIAVIFGVVASVFSGLLPVLHAAASHAEHAVAAREQGKAKPAQKRHACSGCVHHRACARTEPVTPAHPDTDPEPSEESEHECALCVHLALGKLACGVLVMPSAGLVGPAWTARTAVAVERAALAAPALARSSRGPPLA